MARKKVAIACQGGGTHAAFTWGVLDEILKTKKAGTRSPDGGTRSISLPSAAPRPARCARLRPGTALPPTPPIPTAARSTRRSSASISCGRPLPRPRRSKSLHNQHRRHPAAARSRRACRSRLQSLRVYGDLGLAGLSMMGARREYLEFPALLEALCPHFDDDRLARRGRRRICGSSSAPSRSSAATSRSSIPTRRWRRWAASRRRRTRPIRRDPLADAPRDLAGGRRGVGDACRRFCRPK